MLFAMSTPAPALIPAPVSLKVGDGAYVLPADFGVRADSGETYRIGEMLARRLRASTGMPIPVGAGARGLDLRLDHQESDLGHEGYRLDVTPNGIEIRAASPAGLFYGTQTLLQLFDPEALRGADLAVEYRPGVGVATLHGPMRPQEWRVPVVSIEDQPRFVWRGTMLDVARHFMPKEFILKWIDLMALHRMNVLHLHLTDDQGWRMEIKRYPKLTEVGAWRRETLVGHGGTPEAQRQFDGVKHGGYYTQDDLREIVAYAAERFVTVVPEIEMPGHAQAAIAAYPELGNLDTPLEVLTWWGVNPNVFNVKPETIVFLQNVLEEVLEVFPSPYIHVGGDEVPKDQWKKNANAQARMRELALKDEHELQSWFIRQMDAWLDARGRKLIGWDEILEGGLAPGAAVMSWRGTQGGIAAAKAGHHVVMAPTSHTYLDYYQSRNTGAEPLAIGGFLPLERVYAFEPIPGELTAEEAKWVLGGQAQLWSEYIKTPKHMEYMGFPRVCALAEVVWSPKEARDFTHFCERLATHLRRLKVLDVNFRALD